MAKRAISTFFAVIFFFALGALVDTREASGQGWKPPCDSCGIGSGYDYKVEIFELDGCEWKVNFCYACPASFVMDIKVLCYTAILEDSNSVCGVLTEARKGKLDSLAAEWSIKQCSVTHPPCDTLGNPGLKHNLRITTPVCWRAENASIWEYIGYDSTWTDKFGNLRDSLIVTDSIFRSRIDYWPCSDSGYCSNFYSVCVDYNQTPPIMRISWKYADLIGHANDCPLPKENPFPHAGRLPWTTYCYRNGSIVNPCPNPNSY